MHSNVHVPALHEVVPAIRPGLFRDVTGPTGIRFSHTNGKDLRYPLLQTMGGGCAFLDYDADGSLDILLLSSGEFGAGKSASSPLVALYHNKGNGTFEDVTQRSGLSIGDIYGQAVAVGDVDNDGYPDIFVAGYGGCRLFHNRLGSVPACSALFADVTGHAGLSDDEQGPRWASTAAFGDYDNDGRLDLIVAHYAAWTPAIDKVCPRADGTPDLCNPEMYDGDAARLFRNEGGGRFTDVTERAGLGKLRQRCLAVAWLDYDGDGSADLFLADDRDPNRLLHNSGHGTFQETAATAGVALGADGVATSCMGIAVGDYDGSGRESLFTSNLNGEGYSLYHNEGSGLFEYRSDVSGILRATFSTSGWGAAFTDLDRDGRPDLVTANGHVNPFIDNEMPGVTYKESLGIFRNTGGGTFQDISNEGGATLRRRSSRGMAVGDFDNDGRVDLLIVNRNDSAELLRNIVSNENGWISVDLVGTRSNRDGAGAKVSIIAEGRRQVAECRLSSSYASSSDKRLFFGVGEARRIAEIEVRWPSGQTDRYSDLEPRRFYQVKEATSCRPLLTPPTRSRVCRR